MAVAESVLGGSVKAYAISGDKRSPTLPDVPTAREMGVAFEISIWAGLFAPKDTPGEVVFVRRWRITPMNDAPPESVAIEVCVFRAPAEGVPARSADACLSTIRTRQP